MRGYGYDAGPSWSLNDSLPPERRAGLGDMEPEWSHEDEVTSSLIVKCLLTAITFSATLALTVAIAASITG